MIFAYLRERFRLMVFGPVATIIAAAGSVSAQLDISARLIDTAVACLLLLQFRLWDDLADRKTDARSRHDRVLVRATPIGPFFVLCIALALVNTTFAVSRDETGLAASALLLLQGSLGVWYARRSRRSLAGDQLLLIKYPAFVLVVAGSRALEAPLTTAIFATAIYAGVSIYEAWHDPASPAAELLGGRS